MTRTRSLHAPRTALLPLLALFALLGLVAETQAGPATRGDPGQPVARAPIHQLRIYEIYDDTRQAFHARFRDHAARIMAKYDFRIVAIWESRSDDRLELVYLLEWPDEATMTERWARFMADPEWAEIKRQTASLHGRFVGEIEQRTLRPTTYSPATVLAP